MKFPYITCGLLLLSQSLFASPLTDFKYKQSQTIKPQPPETRIVGGKEAELGEYPFMVALVGKGKDAFNGQFCGASYVGDGFVLTAAHCVEGASADQIDAVIGIHDLKSESEQGKRIAVSHIYAHQQYNSQSMENDIALLQLAEKPELPALKPISEELMAKVEVGNALTVMGWGNRSGEQGTNDFPNVLHEVDVPLVAHEVCQSAYDNGLFDSMICAGYQEGGKDSCQGDSGGPIIAKVEEEWYQVGVVSFGNGCAQPDSYGVYTRVASFPNWLAASSSGISLQSPSDLGILETGYQGEYDFVLQNSSTQSVVINSTQIDNTSPSKLEIVSDTCEGIEVAAGGQCIVKVKLQLAESGEQKFGLSLNTNHQDAKQVTTTSSVLVLAADDSDLNTAVDIQNGTWFKGGDQNWISQTEQVSNGDTAISNSDINDLEVAIAMLKIDATGDFTFDYKVSSETDYDFLVVLLNGEVALQESGEQTSFSSKTLSLTEGTNRIAFVYAKDESESAGNDTAYIDNIRFEGSNETGSGGDGSGDNGSGGDDSDDENNEDSPSSGSSSGSMGWLLLTALGLGAFRRKFS